MIKLIKKFLPISIASALLLSGCSVPQQEIELNDSQVTKPSPDAAIQSETLQDTGALPGGESAESYQPGLVPPKTPGNGNKKAKPPEYKEAQPKETQPKKAMPELTEEEKELMEGLLREGKRLNGFKVPPKR